MSPNYGATTLMRPMVANLPDAPAGAVRSRCPYCGAACWITRAEIQTGPVLAASGVTFTAACTACAFNRGVCQQQMDRKRWEGENAEVCELAAAFD